MNNEYNPEKQVIVVGYPKSGNTWLSRLLGDVLDSPVTGWVKAKPLATEGLERSGEYTVRQLHLHPRGTGDHFIEGANVASIPGWRGEKVVHIIRDPRDVIVSAYHYWNMNSMDFASAAVCYGKHPLIVAGPWDKFVLDWAEMVLIPVPTVFYERLHADTVGEVMATLAFLGFDIPLDVVEESVERQSFENKRAQIKQDGSSRPYGKKIQLSNLRKGMPGDWKNYLSHIQLERIYAKIGDTMEKIGYLEEE